MGVVETWNNFERRVGKSFGDGAALASQNSAIMEAVVGTLCPLAQKYPDKWVGSNYRNAWVNSACENSNQESFPESQAGFSGGQCIGVSYRVVTSEDTEGQTRLVSNVVNGPFNGIKYLNRGTATAGDGSTVRLWVGIIDAASQGQSAVTRDFFIPDGTPPPGRFNVSVVSVERLDGNSDDCGNPDPYPPSGTANPDDYKVNVDYGDGEKETFVRDPDIPIGERICFTGETHTICVDGDGVDITPNDDDIEELEQTEEEDVEEAEEEDPEIIYITTEITSLPIGDKVILHKDQRDNDYFAGYMNWLTATKRGIYRHPTIPIRKTLQIFNKPDYATGYKVYTVNNAKLKTTVYKKPKEE